MTDTNTQELKTMNLKELTAMVLELQKQISELSTAKAKPEVKEMTKADALRVLNGDLKDKKHKEAAEALGLTYGQVYSCRLEFTFKDVHKELKGEGFKNAWTK